MSKNATIEINTDVRMPEVNEPKKADYMWANPYYSDPKRVELINAVEKALGFKLFYWQKTYIETGEFRQYGKTTAEILRDLLDLDADPLDFSIPAATRMEFSYRDTVRSIQEKLRAAGIPTRRILWGSIEEKTAQELENQDLANKCGVYLHGREGMAEYHKKYLPPDGYWSGYYTGKIDAYREALNYLKSVDRKE